jgi:hypothetical protein
MKMRFFKNYIFLPKVMDDWHKLKEKKYFLPPEKIKIKKFQTLSLE